MPDFPYSNRLIHETSPYLLQHAHNPVDWHSWNEDTLQKAIKLDKMLLISIGYAACHWCHVMEKESFTDEKVAGIMNENFICIKVDREERPDVDQVYMQAVQMITGSGGWPLNCFALPDGKPFFGGTYFRKEQWLGLLENIALLYKTRKKDLLVQALQITDGLGSLNLINFNDSSGDFSPGDGSALYEKLYPHLDLKDGGTHGAPKFPMPVIHHFLLDYYTHSKIKEIPEFLKLSLRNMAYGGIFDQIGGGFARYSTDSHWKVPHFEKMLYDNAQLVSLYGNAYRLFKDPLYKETIELCLDFIKKEMTGPEGYFYSSLDADSEGEEGRYYIWSDRNFKEVLGPNADLIGKFYGVGERGRWEAERNILLRQISYSEFAKAHKLSPSSFRQLLTSSRQKLLKARSKRIRPALDDKVLTSWNALMASGYIAAYRALKKQEYLDAALKNIRFLLDNVSKEDGSLFHSWKNTRATVNGFLEDYAFLIKALLDLHEVLPEESWLQKALSLTDYTIEHFFDKSTGLFHFNSDLDRPLVSRQHELFDNVIPSSGSVMAESLIILGQLFENDHYTMIAETMLKRIRRPLFQQASAFMNWARIWLKMTYPFYIVAVTGENVLQKIFELDKNYFPNIYITGSTKASDMPYLRERYIEDKTIFYVCTGKECKLPTEDVAEVIKMLE